MPTDSPLKNSSVVLRGSKVQEPLPQKFNATLKQHQSIHSGPLNKMQIYALWSMYSHENFKLNTIFVIKIIKSNS